MDKQLLEKFLYKELRDIKGMINYDPYTIIASDNKDIREFFIDNIKDDVIVMENYGLYYPKCETIHKNLQNNNVLLLNFEQRVKEYSEHHKNKFDRKWHAIYYSLIPYRDLFRKNGMHSIVIVCDNDTAYGALRDSNLGSAVYACFIDRRLERAKKSYKNIRESKEDKDTLLAN